MSFVNIGEIGSVMSRKEQLNRAFNDDSIKAEDIDKDLIIAYKGIYNRYLKRGLDFIFALVCLAILLPIYIIVGVAIVIDTGRPVFYRAERGGYHGKSFKIYKFRSMVQNAEQIGGGTTALNDQRITRVGKVIRKTKIDEIANLISILKGDMSFIGPRPELIKYTSQYRGTEKLILEVRPGITDYSSIEFINLDEIVGSCQDADANYEKYVLPKKNKLRIKYVANISLKTDVGLFFLTVWKVLEKVIKLIKRK